MGIKTVLLALCSVFLATAGQLILKSGMNKVGYIGGERMGNPVRLLFQLATTWQVVVGLGVFFVSAGFWILVLSRVPLSFAYPFAGLTYLLITLFGKFVLREHVPGLRWLGIALIISGILVVGKTAPPEPAEPARWRTRPPEPPLAAKSLVTGGAGFIGSHLVDALVASGRQVRVVDNLASGEQRLQFLEAAAVEVDRIDIRSPECSELIDSFAPDEIFHLAAQMDVRRSVADPIYDADVNVLGTLRVLEGARRVGARVMPASSGGCIYGEVPPEDLPAGEGTPKNPDSPYGITKSVMGDYLRFYRHTYELDYVTLALGNVFGPRQDPMGEAGVVAIFGKRLIEGARCTIFGDGEQTRDFVYVGDVVDAFLAAASAGEGETINIGTGVQTSVNQLYWEMAAVCGVETPPVYAPARAGELQRSCLDSSKAGALLGWSPRVKIAEGLAATVEFMRNHP